MCRKIQICAEMKAGAQCTCPTIIFKLYPSDAASRATSPDKGRLIEGEITQDWISGYREKKFLQFFRIEHMIIKIQPCYPEYKSGTPGGRPLQALFKSCGCRGWRPRQPADLRQNPKLSTYREKNITIFRIVLTITDFQP